jgi:RNA polymerase primary sigma factor
MPGVRSNKNPGQHHFDEAVLYFFDDVARLPIISNRAQELLLGIHLRAETRARSLVRVSTEPDTTNLSLGASITEAITALVDWCASEKLSAPRIDSWGNEILTSRQQISLIKNSRIDRFMRRVNDRNSKGDPGPLLTFEVLELLAMLPAVDLWRVVSAYQEPVSNANVESLPETLLRDTSAQELLSQVKQRALNCRLMLVQGYLRYVLRLARNYVEQGLDYMDLVQVGALGLMRAAEKFDYREQARFGVYATSWIWQRITRSVADQSRAIRIPAHRAESINKLKRACVLSNGALHPLRDAHVLHCAELLTTAERDLVSHALQTGEAIDDDVWERYVVACRQAERLLNNDLDPLPLHQIILPQTVLDRGEDKDGGYPLYELLPPEDSPSIEYEIDQNNFTAGLLESLLECLTDRERAVLTCRFGLDDGQEKTLKETGPHFGLSRERIRQIESGAFSKLRGEVALGRLPFKRDALPYLEQDVSVIKPRINADGFNRWLANDEDESADWRWLDILNQRLPRGESNFSQRTDATGSRAEQLAAALKAIGTPAHYHDVIEQANELFPGQEMSEASGYACLNSEQETFLLLGQGVFSLVKWEQQRSQEAYPILPYCPLVLPDPPDYDHAFFESVFVARRELQTQPTTSMFLDLMFKWAQANEQRSRWLEQSALSAYYLVGLIPYVFFDGGADPRLQDVLPHGNMQALRYTCLRNLTKRLTAMPEFWWLLQHRQPIRPQELGEEFADIHPFGLDDVLQRLYLLTSLGAAVRSSQGHYSLAGQGIMAAKEWAVRPKSEFPVESILTTGATSTTPDALFDFAFWE